MSGASSTGVPNRSPIRPSTSSTRWPVPARARATLAPIQTFTSPWVTPATTTRGDPAAGLRLEGEPEMAEQVRLAGARVERRHRRQVLGRRQVREQRRGRGVLDRGGVVDGVGAPVAPDRGRGRQAEGQQQPESEREPQVRGAEGVRGMRGVAGGQHQGPVQGRAGHLPDHVAVDQDRGHRVGDRRGGVRVTILDGDVHEDRAPDPVALDRATQLRHAPVGRDPVPDLVDDPPGVGELRQGRAQRVGIVGLGHARLLRGADRGRCGVRLRGKEDPGCDGAAGDHQDQHDKRSLAPERHPHVAHVHRSPHTLLRRPVLRPP